MKNIVLTILLLMNVNMLFGEITYYNYLRKAEQCIIEEKLDSSLYYYNIAFNKKDYPFTRDMLTAACVAHYADKESYLYSILEKLLKRGMSIEELNYFRKKRPNDTVINNYYSSYEKYNQKYLSSINYSYESKMRTIDRDNQIELNYRNDYLKNKKRRYFDITDSALVKRYIDLVDIYGMPTERNIGIGSGIALLWANVVDVRQGELSKWKNNGKAFFENIFEYDLKKRGLDSLYLFYSHSINTKINSLTKRRGNSFLWHINTKEYPVLDSILLDGVYNCYVYPEFYASCLERVGDDYGLSWGSDVMVKYKFDIKRVAESNYAADINKRRRVLGIRSLDMDVKLFKAISKLEKLKYKHYFRRKVKGKSLFVRSLFVSQIP